MNVVPHGADRNHALASDPHRLGYCLPQRGTPAAKRSRGSTPGD
jgi:hypothetical protein